MKCEMQCEIQFKNTIQNAMQNTRVMRNDMQSDMQNNVQLHGVGGGCDYGEMSSSGGCRGGVSGRDSVSGSGGDSRTRDAMCVAPCQRQRRPPS